MSREVKGKKKRKVVKELISKKQGPTSMTTINEFKGYEINLANGYGMITRYNEKKILM